VSLLVVFRSGGNWSTTYAPSPFYMTSKMRSLYLEGYDYSIFDLTRPDRVQIQVGSRSTGQRIYVQSINFFPHNQFENIVQLRRLIEYFHS